MKFRIRTNDTGCVEHFADVIQMFAGLTKNAIFRVNKNQLTLSAREYSTFGSMSAWCDIDYVNLFSERICDGISSEQDEILLELVLDHLLHCIRVSSSAPVNVSSVNTLMNSDCNYTQVDHGTNVLRQSRLTNSGQLTHRYPSSATINGLKIKLVRRKIPCLAIELEQSSFTGRPRSVWHFIPVHIVPPRLWDEFLEPSDPDFDVSIFFPPIKTLRPFVDRMKKFARVLTISANGLGLLNFSVNVESLASVKLVFKGLKARSWLLTADISVDGEEPHSAIWESNKLNSMTYANEQSKNQTADDRFVSVNIDIRRVSQLLTSVRCSPSWFVCNIVHEHLAQFVLIFDNYKLKYNVPASAL